MPRASVCNIMICHQQKIHLQPEAMVNWKQQPVDLLSLAYSLESLLWYISKRGRQGVGLELFVGLVDKGSIGGFQY